MSLLKENRKRPIKMAWSVNPGRKNLTDEEDSGMGTSIRAHDL